MRLKNVMMLILGIYHNLDFIQNKFTNFFSVAGQDGLRYWRDMIVKDIPITWRNSDLWLAAACIMFNPLFWNAVSIKLRF